MLRTVRARAHWRQIDFISDLHLHAGDQATFAAWRDYLRSTSAQAVFVLGDLFEVWVGDDVLSAPDPSAPDHAFVLSCVQVLRQAGERLDLFFLCGNRDFLLGPRCLQACAMQGLDDPCVLALGPRAGCCRTATRCAWTTWPTSSSAQWCAARRGSPGSWRSR